MGPYRAYRVRTTFRRARRGDTPPLGVRHEQAQALGLHEPRPRDEDEGHDQGRPRAGPLSQDRPLQSAHRRPAAGARAQRGVHVMDDPIRITSTYPGPDGSVFTALDQTCGYCNRGPLRDPTVYLECVGYLHADCAMALGQLYEQ